MLIGEMVIRNLARVLDSNPMWVEFTIRNLVIIKMYDDDCCKYADYFVQDMASFVDSSFNSSVLPNHEKTLNAQTVSRLG